MPSDYFAPPPPDEPTRVKPRLCGVVQEEHDCGNQRRCILYVGHSADVPHRADRCGHRWPVVQ